MVVEGVAYLRANILRLLVGAYLKFLLKGWVLIGRSVLNPGGHLLSSPVRNQVTTLVLFYSLHSHRVINNVAIEIGFLSIPTTKESDGGGEAGTFLREAC